MIQRALILALLLASGCASSTSSLGPEHGGSPLPPMASDAEAPEEERSATPPSAEVKSAPSAMEELTPATAPPPPPPLCQVSPIPLSREPSALIEDPKGTLGPFYEAMTQTLLKAPGAVTRIGHWSDSTLASDGVSSFARRRLQLSYGDAGHGFVLPIRTITHYAHRDVQRWSGGTWYNTPLVGGKTRDGRYGLGGWVSLGRKHAWATIATATKRSPVGHAMSKLHVYYMSGPKQGELSVKVDAKAHSKISTHADEVGEEMATIEVPDGEHRVALRVTSKRSVRLFGVALEREGPGFIYDSFGILGALARRFVRVEPEHWATQLKMRDHDLVMIQFGGNSIQDGGISYTRYREQYRQLIRLFTTHRPETPCIVMSPHDHGRKRGRGVIDTDPKLLKILTIQREVAFEEGCAFFSVFDAMGGEGSMGRYFRERLAYADLRHLRFAGAERIADHIVDAIEAGFNAHRQKTCGSEEERRVEPHLKERPAQISGHRRMDNQALTAPRVGQGDLNGVERQAP